MNSNILSSVIILLFIIIWVCIKRDQKEYELKMKQKGGDDRDKS